MRKTRSIFTSSRRKFLMLGILFCLTFFGVLTDQTNAQGGRVIRATNAVGQPGGQVTIFFQLDSQGNESSASFTFNFNPAVLTFASAAVGNGVPAGTNFATNTTQAAQGSVGALVDSTNTYAAGTRNMFSVTFTIAANAPLGQYPITFSSTPTPQSVSSAGGTLLPTTYLQGIVQIGSTASGVEVSGRVLTPEGRGIRSATVILTDASGERRTVTTSSFGVYRFEDVPTGATYTVSVSSKQYRFTPRVIQIVDSLSDFDFIAQQ